MAQTVINGIDTEALGKTMSEIEKNPEIAQFNFRTINTWIDGTHNQATVKEFLEAGKPNTSRQTAMVFEEDEPPILLGRNLGANPVEYVLVGLSGCLTTALVANAAAQGIRLKSVKSYLDGNLDARGFLGLSEQVRNGYESIKVRFEIESDEPEERLYELVKTAKERSPVFDIVTNPVPVQVIFEKK